MRDYCLVTDSCCDLSPALAEKAGLTVIPMSLNLEGKEYLNYLDGREIATKDFYDRLRSGAHASTSAINIDVFINTFEPILKNGKDVLYLGFSSGLSSTYHVSTMAAEELAEATGAEVVTVIGSKLVLYRESVNKKKIFLDLAVRL